MSLMPKSKTTFKEIGLQPWIIDTLKKLSIKEPTEIQTACISAILQGKNVVGGAKTGSGKTAAFALPILQQLSIDPYGIYALILTPTRELAIQIQDQIKTFGRDINIQTALIIGGNQFNAQLSKLENKPHIVVATPGRLADIISNQPDLIRLDKIKFLVLDEADNLLKEQFLQNLGSIFQVLNKDRQTLLFTATITESVLDACKSSSKELFIHLCKSETSTVTTLMQRYIFVPSRVREFYLYYLVNMKGNLDKSTIIFVESCVQCELIYWMFKELDISCLKLNSKMGQKDRTRNLKEFRNRKSLILVTTDVSSRGLDIPFVDLVINFNVPKDPNTYIHRVGRTARAGREGKAITIISERDIELVHKIEEKTNNKMKELVLSENKVLLNSSQITKAKSKASSIIYAMELKKAN